MNIVLRPLLALLLLALVSACGQMGPLVIPEKKAASAPTPAENTAEPQAPVQPDIKPESAPLQVP